MSRQDPIDKFKRDMRDRLAADPRSLDLNPRMDEAPEDKYVLLAEAGRRTEVVGAVTELIAEAMTRARGAKPTTVARLLLRAVRLCSVLGAVECAPVLRLILLEDPSAYWGGHLNEVQEVAARALLGLPKRKADLRFWVDVAHRRQTSLPYALRALIEIDLDEGLRVFWQLFLPDPKKEHPLIDWRCILEEADEHYAENVVASRLEETFYEVCGECDPRHYEQYMRYLQLGKYSRVSTRSIYELPLSPKRIGKRQTYSLSGEKAAAPAAPIRYGFSTEWVQYEEFLHPISTMHVVN